MKFECLSICSACVCMLILGCGGDRTETADPSQPSSASRELNDPREDDTRPGISNDPSTDKTLAESQAGEEASTTAQELPAPKPLKLVEHEFQFSFDDVRYTILAPPGTTIEPDQDHVEFHFGNRFDLVVEFGPADLAADLSRAFDSEVVSETPDTVLLKEPDFTNSLEPPWAYNFGMNRTLGYRDFFIYSQPEGIVLHSQPDCRTMMKAAESLKVAESLPEDPVAVLALFGDVFRDGDGNVFQLTLGPFGITDATMPLLAHCNTVERLYCLGIDASEESFSVLAKMPNLQDANLSGTNVVDEGVSFLKDLKHLKVLVIGPGIKLGGIKRLRELERIERLALSSDELDDETLAEFPIMPALKELSIGGKFNGKGFAHLSDQPRLEKLSLNQEGITDAGLEGIGQLTGLEHLDLSQCEKLTGDGISHLVKLMNIERLELFHSSVRDDAVQPLSKMKFLRYLDISNTQISRQGYEKLKTALPDCEIAY